MAKVLVVDDGDIGRLGRTAALEVAGHCVTAARWSEVGDLVGQEIGPGSHDALLAVVHPDETSWDRYRVLAAVAPLTATLGPATRTVGLVANDAVHNPLLALRLARAGLVRLAADTSVRTLDDIHAIVMGDGASWLAEPSGTELAMVGVAPGTDPEAIVHWVLDRLAGPDAAAYANAFDPRCTQSACGLSRRRAHAVRVRLTALGRIQPNQLHSGGGPVRDRSLPRWNEVVTVANLCRGIDGREAGAAREVVGGQAYTWRAA